MPLSLNTAVVLSIPKELWRLVDYLHKHSLDTPNLFKEPGDGEQIDELVEMLDTGADLSNFRGNVHSVARCLVYFLESLEHPVVPVSVFNKSTEAFHSLLNCQKFLLGISTTHYNVFHYIVAFLRDGVLEHSKQNQLSVDSLVEIFAPVLVRPDKQDGVVLEGCAQFLRNFLLVPQEDVIPKAGPLISK
mmetsp:Transcript_23207/g.29607  ORF Transcript_23207/g.29607 Transcript_23207/m.29607 type:complete len:189 (-) Transcript_23207:3-569(-)